MPPRLRMPETVRVLTIIDSLEPAGAERSLAQVTGRLVAAGIDLHVLHFGPRPGLGPAMQADGARVHHVPAPTRRLRLAAAGRTVARVRPDLVHTTLFEADLAGRIAATFHGTPVLSSLVNTPYGEAERRHGRVPAGRLLAARAADTATARLVHRFHAISETVADVMASRLRVHRERIHVVPRGRDPERLGVRSAARRHAARRALGLEGHPGPILLVAARHEPQKGLDLLLAAVPRITDAAPHAVVLLAGREGRATADLHRAAGPLGDRVRFLGPRDDVADLMVAADCTIVPSRWEGFGGVAAEALALESPLVCTDLAVLTEVAPADVAMHVRTGDVRSLADGVLTVLADPAAAARRTEAGRIRFLERYTADVAAAAMADLYRRCLVPEPPTGRRAHPDGRAA